MNTFVKLSPCLYNQSTLEQGELSSLAAEIASIQTIIPNETDEISFSYPFTPSYQD